MKTFLPALLLSTLTFAACQSANAGNASADGTRTIDLAGTQARTTVELPASDSTNSAQPYALQGYQAGPVATPTGMGYQAR